MTVRAARRVGGNRLALFRWACRPLYDGMTTSPQVLRAVLAAHSLFRRREAKALSACERKTLQASGGSEVGGKFGPGGVAPAGQAVSAAARDLGGVAR
jgi:hypothetical protein